MKKTLVVLAIGFIIISFGIVAWYIVKNPGPTHPFVHVLRVIIHQTVGLIKVFCSWPAVVLIIAILLIRMYPNHIGNLIANIKKVGSLEFEKIAKDKLGASHWYSQGELYRLHKKYENAEFAFRAAIELDNTYHAAYMGLARTLVGKGRLAMSSGEKQDLFKAALDISDEIIEQKKKFGNNIHNPDAAPAFLTRAVIHCAMGASDAAEKARADLQHAMSLDPLIKRFILEEDELEVMKRHQWFKNMTGLQ